MQCKQLAVTALAAIFLAAPFTPAEAVSPNPFATQKYLTLDGTAEQEYILRRVHELYEEGGLSQLTVSTDYEVDAGWRFEQAERAGVPTDIFTPKKPGTDRVMLFLHGGAYLGGQNNLYRDWGLHLAMLADNAVMYMPDYRHTPHHKHPTALDDSMAVYQYLLESGVPAEKIILVGDSAGGHLALVLLQQLKANGTQLPGRLLLISPWADTGITLPSRLRNLGRDQLLHPRQPVLLEIVKNPPYLAGHDPKHPMISPVYMDMAGLPPTLITAGTDELLLDDALLVKGYMQAAGVEASLKLYQGMSHDWTIVLPELKESREMFTDIRTFLKEANH